MSMTKRFLESLPANEPDERRDWLDARFSSRLADMAEDAEDELRWAQALMEEDEEPNDPLVKCRVCRRTWPISEMNTNGECPDCQLEEKEEARLTTADYLKAQIAKAEADIAHGVGNRESKEKRLAALMAVLAREEAPLVKPQPPSVKAGCFDI